MTWDRCCRSLYFLALAAGFFVLCWGAEEGGVALVMMVGGLTFLWLAARIINGDDE
jgi:hypothetical protein